MAKRGCQSLSAVTMVDSISIENFRGFGQLSIDELALINIVVGDNAVGKTALLEAVFLTMSGNAQQAMTLKQWRGQDIRFQAGSGDSIAESLYGDLFNNAYSEGDITIRIRGRGFENRQLVISRLRGNVLVTTKDVPRNRRERRATKAAARGSVQQVSEALSVPIALTWSDENGRSYETHPRLTPSGLQFDGTNETLPTCFLFAAQTPVPSTEAATHFNLLKKKRTADKFRNLFMSVFDDVVGIDTGDIAGGSVLMVDVPWSSELLPLSVVSGGTNRAAAIMLAISFRENGLVLIDEIDSGIFYRRQKALSTALIETSRAYKTQLVMTTHSEEWIMNFLSGAGDHLDDIAFWRMERIESRSVMRRFSATEFRAGLSIGEMR
jgi:AAA domain, putative AbiEii toxin, Type IV TA system/AAA domain